MENHRELEVLILACCMGMLLIIISIFTFFVLHRKKMLEKEAKIETIEYEKKIEIFKASTEAEEKQKLRIASDLHDSISATLMAVIRSIDKNIKDYEIGKFNLERMRADLRTIETAKDNIRNVSHDLIPPNVLSHSLLTALDYYINTFRDLEESKADFENKTAPDKKIPFTKTDEVNIFRICQEIMNNLLKHSKYKYLKVTVDTFDHNLVIEFVHDGKGITNNEIVSIRESGNGLGLNSIFSRIMRVNGTIDYTIEQEIAIINIKIPLKL